MRCFLGGCTIFSRIIPHCFGAVLWAFGSKVLAAELPAIEFSLSPRICVLTKADEACYDELTVQWRAKEQLSLCLYRSDFEQPLNCWVNADKGAHSFVLSTTENVTFHLREMNKGVEVSEAFEVIHDRKQYRRQRRNPWSFF